jgi:hypothetical protein
MRNVLLARYGLALALSAAAAPGLASQAPAAAHAHPGVLEGRTLHQGDRLWFRGQRTVGADEVIEGDVVVASGSLTVRGEVHGDAVVGGGDLVLEAGSVVYGDAVVTGGNLVNRGGSVLGKVQQGGPARAVGTQSVHVRPGFLGSLGQGWSRLVGIVALGIVLGALGMGVSVYGRRYLQQASDVVRRAPLDAIGIGLSANVLAIPAFLAGMAALTLTLVGIPLLLVFIPMFWTAICVLAAVGLVAVAYALGERRAERRKAGEGNAFGHLLTGLLFILAPLAAAQLLGMITVTGAAAKPLSYAAWTLLWLAASLGAGAVLIVGVRTWQEHSYHRAVALGGMDDLGTGGLRSDG